MNDNPQGAAPPLVSKKAVLLSWAGIAAAAFALLVALSYAWFRNASDASTLIAVQPPSNIAILEPDSNLPLETLKLSSADGQKDQNGKITLQKVFRVQSTDDFQLEIAHTTNLKGLQFNLYQVQAVTGGTESETHSVTTQNGKVYSYSSTPLDGSYVNLGEAAEDGTYGWANGSIAVKESETDQNQTFHSENYGSYTHVQKHAEPLYWKSQTVTHSNNTTGNDFYFMCEVSWTATDKETDLFYILAEHIEKQTSDTQTGSG